MPEPQDDRDTPDTQPSWYTNRTLAVAARRTLQSQENWIRQIDEKAMRTLRFNTVLLGLLLPGFSYAVRHGIVASPEAFYNDHAAAGVGLLLASIVLAGLTYTSSSVQTDISADDISTAQANAYTDATTHDALVSGYELSIRENRGVLFWNAVLVNATVFSMVAGLTALALGTVVALGIPVPPWASATSYAALGAFLVLSQAF